MALRASEQAPDTSGKYDVGYRDSSGNWHHISRRSNEEEARTVAEELANLSEEEQNLIGLPESPDIEIIER